MNEVRRLFGNRLKKLRTERRMSLDEMGVLLGTTKQVLSRYENGQREPNISTAALYAERLGVDLGYLIGEEQYKSFSHAAAPQTRLVLSCGSKERAYNINPGLTEWFFDLLDHLSKLECVCESE